MPNYNIVNTDGTVIATVEDSTTDTSTLSIKITGRKIVDFGKVQAENQLWILENFSNATPPSNPIEGQLWYDSNLNLIKVYNGATFVVVGEVVDDLTPQLGGQLDVNGNAIGDGIRELITFVEDPGAVNQIEIENEETGSGPIIRAAGDNTDIDINVLGKGTGVVALGTITIGGGTNVTGILSATDTLDFGSIAPDSFEDLTITVTGAATGDAVALGLPTTPDTAVVYQGWVSATNTVTVRAMNVTTADAVEPSSGTFRATVIQH